MKHLPCPDSGHNYITKRYEDLVAESAFSESEIRNIAIQMLLKTINSEAISGDLLQNVCYLMRPEDEKLIQNEIECLSFISFADYDEFFHTIIEDTVECEADEVLDDLELSSRPGEVWDISGLMSNLHVTKFSNEFKWRKEAKDQLVKGQAVV